MPDKLHSSAAFSAGTFPFAVDHGSSILKHMLFGLLNKDHRREEDIGFPTVLWGKFSIKVANIELIGLNTFCPSHSERRLGRGERKGDEEMFCEK